MSFWCVSAIVLAIAAIVALLLATVLLIVLLPFAQGAWWLREFAASRENCPAVVLKVISRVEAVLYAPYDLVLFCMMECESAIIYLKERGENGLSN